MEKLVSESKTYDFLKEEEDLYSLEDLKEKILMNRGGIILIPFPYRSIRK